MNRYRLWIQQHAFVLFLVLTLIFSWWAWPLFLQGSMPLALLPAGPLLAALIVVPLGFGLPGVKEWLRTTFKWRVRPIWYVVAIGFPIVLTAVPAGINILLGATPSTANWPTNIGSFLMEEFIFTFLMVALGEEMGFSAFALPNLLRKYSVLATVGILALTRVAWHLPLFLTGDTEWPVILLLIPTQLIFTWMFIGSGGSALLMVLSHISIASIGNTFFTRLFSGPEMTQVVWLQAAAFVIAGVVLLLTTDFWRAGSNLPETAVTEDVQSAIP
ncbi:MAG: CPBP family intramembrane metalloprotease [Anaerolineales bacterium]|nr:CPBP family intramembrane metalloprotease [Anaerolineales bacterium]